MATLKKLKEDTLNITSKILKKDEDFLPISPEFIKDLKDKTLLENSALKLSISDYELMCNNKTILNMMAIALNKPKAKLKKFCKHITVFKENISKSPKSIANKINGINGPITNLPIGVRSIILEKFAEILPTKYVLLDWIDKDKLNWEGFSRNPNAIDLLENEYYNKIQWLYLSRNPNAIDLLKDRIEYEKSLTNEELDELENRIDWEELSENPNAIELLKKNQDKINWQGLSSNPNAIKLLKKNQDKINWVALSSNPNAIDLLKKKYDKINWYLLCKNPGAINLLKDRIEYEKSLTQKQYNDLYFKDKIIWNNLSANPNAINLLLENKDKINWSYLSANPNAIELLKKNYDKISWKSLSSNPNAIDLLKENQDKIDWYRLSTNPAIFKAV